MNLERIKAGVLKTLGEIAATTTRPAPEPGKPDEARLIERATWGAEAQALLGSRQTQEFMAASEAQLIERLTSLPLEDDNGRARLALAIQTQRQFWKYLAACAQDGRVATKELERLQGGSRPFF